MYSESRHPEYPPLGMPVCTPDWLVHVYLLGVCTHYSSGIDNTHVRTRVSGTRVGACFLADEKVRAQGFSPFCCRLAAMLHKDKMSSARDAPKNTSPIPGGFLAGLAAGVLTTAGVVTLLSKLRSDKTIGADCGESTVSVSAPPAQTETEVVGGNFPEYTTLRAEQLRSFAKQCLVAAGCSVSNASIVADVLLEVSKPANRDVRAS